MSKTVYGILILLLNSYGMPYFLNGNVKKDMTLKNTTNGGQEKLARIYTIRGKKQTEVDELCCGDIGMIPKLVNTNTNDTLGGAFDYEAITYPKPYMKKAILPKLAEAKEYFLKTEKLMKNAIA